MLFKHPVYDAFVVLFFFLMAAWANEFSDFDLLIAQESALNSLGMQFCPVVACGNKLVLIALE